MEHFTPEEIIQLYQTLNQLQVKTFSQIILDLAPHIIALVSLTTGLFVPLMNHRLEYKRQMARQEIENRVKISDHLKEKNQAHLDDIVPWFSKFIELALSRNDNEALVKSYVNILVRLRKTNKEEKEIQTKMQDIMNTSDINAEGYKDMVMDLADSIREYARIETEFPTDVLSTTLPKGSTLTKLTKWDI